jgi:hypothetical protein
MGAALRPRSLIHSIFFRICAGDALAPTPDSFALIACPGMATCYPRSMNRNIFYIIGVIVVIVIVLKVLGLF